MKIIACEISPLPISVEELLKTLPISDWKMPEVKVTFEDNSQKVLFSYYPDEISFTEQEFIGKTEDEARELRRQKDLYFLQNDLNEFVESLIKK